MVIFNSCVKLPEGNYTDYTVYGTREYIYIYIYIYIYLGKFHHDLTSRPSPGIMVSKGNHPQMGLIQISEIL